MLHSTTLPLNRSLDRRAHASIVVARQLARIDPLRAVARQGCPRVRLLLGVPRMKRVAQNGPRCLQACPACRAPLLVGYARSDERTCSQRTNRIMFTVRRSPNALVLHPAKTISRE